MTIEMNLTSIHGKTIVTTGANSGIGLAVAIAVARRGFHSVATVRSKENAAIVLEAARRAQVDVETTLLDVTDDAGCQDVITRFRPFGLVNNAGIPCWGAVEEVEDLEARVALETMLVGPIRLARLAVPAMRESGGGRIVFVSSAGGRASSAMLGWYDGSKHALEAVADALRREVARDGIGVTLVEPGLIKTDLLYKVRRQFEQHSHGRYLEANKVAARLDDRWGRFAGKPETVADVIVNAITRPRCKARRLIGVDARIRVMAEAFLPTSASDWLWRRTFGLRTP